MRRAMKRCRVAMLEYLPQLLPRFLALRATASGLLVWENGEDETHPPRHMTGVSRARVLALWLLLADGDVAAVDAKPWLPGYGPFLQGA